MTLLTIVGVGLCGMAMHLLLEGLGRKDIAMIASAACGAVILGSLVQPVQEVLHTLQQAAAGSGLPQQAVQLMLKVAGMSLLTELAAQLCRDAGTGSLAQKIELAGKGMILCAAVPVMEEFVAAALRLLS